jgi:hypothetical protein
VQQRSFPPYHPPAPSHHILAPALLLLCHQLHQALPSLPFTLPLPLPLSLASSTDPFFLRPSHTRFNHSIVFRIPSRPSILSFSSASSTTSQALGVSHLTRARLSVSQFLSAIESIAATSSRGKRQWRLGSTAARKWGRAETTKTSTIPPLTGILFWHWLRENRLTRNTLIPFLDFASYPFRDT